MKFKLDLDHLQVESFQLEAATSASFGESDACLEPTWSSCAGIDTCPKTYCGGPTCGLTCWPGCSINWCPQ